MQGLSHSQPAVRQNESMGRVDCAWHAKLGGRFEVFRNGRKLAPPPNQTVAVLFLGLLLRGPTWTGREELDARLYPESDPLTARNAVRQALFRMRRWLGKQALEVEGGRVRLSLGAFDFDLCLPDGRPAERALLAPGLIHPWLEELRRSLSAEQRAPAPRPTLRAAAEAFALAVKSASAVDASAGRALLLGGQELHDALTAEQLFDLLHATRPMEWREPLAVEHLELQGRLLYKGLALPAATELFRRAHRLAVQRKDADADARTQSMFVFSLLESGLMAAARDAIDPLLKGVKRKDRSRLPGMCAIAEHYWNSNRLGEAMQAMQEGSRIIEGAGRIQQLTFWCNYSLLAAEAGDEGKSMEAAAKAEELHLSELDLWADLILRHADAERLIAARHPQEAASCLHALVAIASKEGFPLRRLWAQESEAEALALAGQSRQALTLWKSAETVRREAGMRPTPRLLAKRRRIRESV